jgi:sporulation protein YlmC with PRC-barrel domain
MAGRELDLHLQLLDRQVVDRDDRLVCKVDDLELEPDEGGNLIVTAILVGPRALGPRLGGRLGRWTTAIAARLSESDVPRIDFGRVNDIGNAIHVDAKRSELAVDPLERWVDDKIIARIPGAAHESS